MSRQHILPRRSPEPQVVCGTVSTTTCCELCGRDKPLTFHHLVPKSMHRKTRFQKRFTKTELRTGGLDVCRLCHDGIHDLISEKELAEKFAAKELLLAHPAVAKHVAWVRKQK